MKSTSAKYAITLPAEKPSAGTSGGVLTAELKATRDMLDNLMFPYQREWVNDKSRLLCGVWGRQTGKSFSTARIVAEDMIATAKKTWIIAAPSERQSIEALDKVKEWIEAYGIAYGEEIEELKGYDCTVTKVTLWNGSRAIAVPAKPETVRCFSGSVWLDEFGHFEDAKATWKALIPIISNPLRGGEKRLVITSTPNGKTGKGEPFYEIVRDNFLSPKEPCAWSVHRVRLSEACAQGLPTDYQFVADALKSEQAVRQELECEFLDGNDQLLTLAMLHSAESPDATIDCPLDLYTQGRDLRIGVDVGRVNDPTVLYCLEKVGDLMITREVLVLQNMSHDEQYEYLLPRLRGATAVCWDYTGMGITMGDFFAAELGKYDPAKNVFGVMELLTFTPALKRDIFPRLRAVFEAPVTIRIPHDEALRKDMQSMEQTCGGGIYSYESPRTADGHSDRCTACALAVRAASNQAADRPMPGQFGGNRPAQNPRRHKPAQGLLAGKKRNRRKGARR